MSDSGTDGAGFKWVGWLRRGGRWRRCCEAPTIGECARLLIAEGDRRGLPSRCRCLTTGGVPRLPQDTPGGAEAARKAGRGLGHALRAGRGHWEGIPP
jgi:hypothetical protein